MLTGKTGHKNSSDSSTNQESGGTDAGSVTSGSDSATEPGSLPQPSRRLPLDGHSVVVFPQGIELGDQEVGLVGRFDTIRVSRIGGTPESVRRRRRLGGASSVPGSTVDVRQEVFLAGSRMRGLRRHHTVTGSPTQAFKVVNRRNFQDTDKTSFFYQTYENALPWLATDDEALRTIMSNLALCEEGQVRVGLWKDVFWELMLWIVSKAWAGNEPLAEGELVFQITSPTAKGFTVKDLTIQGAMVSTVPEYKIFLERLIRVQKTLDTVFVVADDSPSNGLISQIKKQLKINIQGIVTQGGQHLGSHVVNDPAVVVSDTIRVVRSMVTVYSGHLKTAGVHPEYKHIRSTASGVELIASLARTPTELNGVMALLKVVARLLDGESTHSTDYQRLCGLKNLPDCLRMRFDMGLRGEVQQKRCSDNPGKPTLENQLGETGYGDLFKFVLFLLRGDSFGYVPVDVAWMDHDAYSDVLKFSRPGLRGMRVHIADLFKASIIPATSDMAAKISEVMALNQALFTLAFSPMGEVPETFYLLRGVRALSDWYADFKNSLPSKGGGKTALKDNLEVNEALGEVAGAMASVANSVRRGSYLAGHNFSLDPLCEIVCTRYGKTCERPLKEAEPILMNLLHLYHSRVGGQYLSSK